MNPPYNGDSHLSFLKMGCNVLSDTGKMVIVEPATWLINIRKNGKAKTYDEIKERINGHIESVMIENLNKEFEVGNNVPFSITSIDMSKTFEFIKIVYGVLNFIGTINVLKPSDIVLFEIKELFWILIVSL